jgi:hypothetical protein
VSLVIYPNGRIDDVDIHTTTLLSVGDLNYLRQQLLSAVNNTGYKVISFRRIGNPLF